MERDLCQKLLKSQIKHFNSRAHVERDFFGLFYCELFFNFNSRAHVERDKRRGLDMFDRIYISTHALTWSATRGYDRRLHRC